MFRLFTFFRLFDVLRTPSVESSVTPSGLWLLVFGAWSDVGQWDDTATWQDVVWVLLSGSWTDAGAWYDAATWRDS